MANTAIRRPHPPTRETNVSPRMSDRGIPRLVIPKNNNKSAARLPTSKPTAVSITQTSRPMASARNANSTTGNFRADSQVDARNSTQHAYTGNALKPNSPTNIAAFTNPEAFETQTQTVPAIVATMQPQPIPAVFKHAESKQLSSTPLVFKSLDQTAKQPTAKQPTAKQPAAKQLSTQPPRTTNITPNAVQPKPPAVPRAPSMQNARALAAAKNSTAKLVPAIDLTALPSSTIILTAPTTPATQSAVTSAVQSTVASTVTSAAQSTVTSPTESPRSGRISPTIVSSPATPAAVTPAAATPIATPVITPTATPLSRSPMISPRGSTDALMKLYATVDIDDANEISISELDDVDVAGVVNGGVPMPIAKNNPLLQKAITAEKLMKVTRIYTPEEIIKLTNGYIRVDKLLWNQIPVGAHIRYYIIGSGEKHTRFRAGGYILHKSKKSNSNNLFRLENVHTRGAERFTFTVNFAEIEEVWKEFGQDCSVEMRLILTSLTQKKTEIIELQKQAIEMSAEIAQLKAQMAAVMLMMRR